MAKFFRTSDDVQISYNVHGKGNPMLLLHGAYLSSRVWDKNMATLSENYRVITMDFRGHGLSTKEQHGHTVDRYARDARELMKHLGLEDVLLVGWSLGGAVALKYWEIFKNDNRLKGLGLIDTSPCPAGNDDWNVHVFRNFNIEGLWNRMAGRIDSFKETNLDMAHKWFLNKEDHKQDIEEMAAAMNNTPPWISSAIYSNFFFQDLKNILTTITVPCISMVPRAKIKGAEFQKAQIPNCTLHIFNTGHALYREHDDKFNKFMLDFADQCFGEDAVKVSVT